MNCQAPFFAGDVGHPETFITTKRCKRPAVAMICVPMVRELMPWEYDEAAVCMTHQTAIERRGASLEVRPLS